MLLPPPPRVNPLMHTGSWNHKEKKGNLLLPDASIIQEVDRKLKPVCIWHALAFSLSGGILTMAFVRLSLRIISFRILRVPALEIPNTTKLCYLDAIKRSDTGDSLKSQGKS